MPGCPYCDECLAIFRAEQKDDKVRSRFIAHKNKWQNYSAYNRDLCPARSITYHESKKAKGIEVADMKTLIEIVADSGKGVIFQGDTGAGKTFALYALSEYFLRTTGRSPAVVFSPRLRQDLYEAATGNDSAAKGRIISKLVSNERLFLDDIGSANMSESFEEVLMLVAEERLSQKGLPIFTSLQQTSAEFIGNSRRRDAILRRLLDHSLIFKFKLAA